MAGQVILIVDDNADNRMLTRDVLEFSGFGTLEATGGVEGVAMAQQHVPDLVLMDIRMPDLGGSEALKLLKEDSRTARIPIVALTSSSMRGDDERFLAEGFDGYLQKPISVREFPDQVRGYLRA
jgi:two-component system, cell cycle response regulator DivK